MHQVLAAPREARIAAPRFARELASAAGVEPERPRARVLVELEQPSQEAVVSCLPLKRGSAKLASAMLLAYRSRVQDREALH